MPKMLFLRVFRGFTVQELQIYEKFGRFKSGVTSD